MRLYVTAEPCCLLSPKPRRGEASGDAQQHPFRAACGFVTQFSCKAKLENEKLCLRFTACSSKEKIQENWMTFCSIPSLSLVVMKEALRHVRLSSSSHMQTLARYYSQSLSSVSIYRQALTSHLALLDLVRPRFVEKFLANMAAPWCPRHAPTCPWQPFSCPRHAVCRMRTPGVNSKT